MTLEKKPSIDLEINFDPQDCKFTGLNTEALRKHLTTLGFNNLLRRLGFVISAAAPPSETGERRLRCARSCIATRPC